MHFLQFCAILCVSIYTCLAASHAMTDSSSPDQNPQDAPDEEAEKAANAPKVEELRVRFETLVQDIDHRRTKAAAKAAEETAKTEEELAPAAVKTQQEAKSGEKPAEVAAKAAEEQARARQVQSMMDHVQRRRGLQLMVEPPAKKIRLFERSIEEAKQAFPIAPAEAAVNAQQKEEVPRLQQPRDQNAEPPAEKAHQRLMEEAQQSAPAAPAASSTGWVPRSPPPLAALAAAPRPPPPAAAPAASSTDWVPRPPPPAAAPAASSTDWVAWEAHWWQEEQKDDKQKNLADDYGPHDKWAPYYESARKANQLLKEADWWEEEHKEKDDTQKNWADAEAAVNAQQEEGPWLQQPKDQDAGPPWRRNKPRRPGPRPPPPPAAPAASSAGWVAWEADWWDEEQKETDDKQKKPY
jgi:hypothetical protein